MDPGGSLQQRPRKPPVLGCMDFLSYYGITLCGRHDEFPAARRGFLGQPCILEEATMSNKNTIQLHAYVLLHTLGFNSRILKETSSSNRGNHRCWDTLNFMSALSGSGRMAQQRRLHKLTRQRWISTTMSSIINIVIRCDELEYTCRSPAPTPRCTPSIVGNPLHQAAATEQLPERRPMSG